MGEASRRKATEPYFGQKPKLGRGIFLSAPIFADDKSVKIVSSSIEPAELRRAALFWDRLVWPDSQIISLGSNKDEQLLESEGLLKRPRPVRYNSEAQVGNLGSIVRIENSSGIHFGTRQSQFFAQQHVEEFFDLERKEPGQWVMSQGEDSFILKDRNFASGRGQIVKLIRAVPLPSPFFPIDELLKFKEKRAPEINALTSEIDRFYSYIAKSKDPDHEFFRLLGVVDKHCADMIMVAKESRWSFHLGDLNFSFSIDNIESAWTRASALEMLVQMKTGLPLVGAALGIGASMLSFDRGVGLGKRKLASRHSPFNAVALMHRELIK